jgi:hypothetical protein
MTDLLGSVIAAHGGLDRWRTVRAIDVTFNFYGGLLDIKGFPDHHRMDFTASSVHRIIGMSSASTCKNLPMEPGVSSYFRKKLRSLAE